MKKIFYLICFFIILISGVKISGNILDILEVKKDIESYNSIENSPEFKTHYMLEPVVKLTYVSQVSTPFGMEMIPISTATGFSVQYDPESETSMIITNDHFCGEFRDDLDKKILIQDFKDISNDNGVNITEGEIVYSDETYDLCLIRTNEFIQPAVLTMEHERVDYFENVYIVGAPSGNFPIIIDTYISTILERSVGSMGNMSTSGEGFLIISEMIFPGHSGSPIYNSNGKVVGVIFASMSSYGALGISSQDIHLFLNDALAP